MNSGQQISSNAIASTNQQQQQSQISTDLEKISCFSLFRFADTKDVILMIIGSVCACAMGAAVPAFSLLEGNIINSFQNSDQVVNTAKGVLFNNLEVAAGTLIAGWGMFACWMISGERQGIQCRKQYFKSLLNQQIGWFDTINQSELASKFASDSFAFQQAIGEKVSIIIMTISMFIVGVAVAMSIGWTLALVTIAALPCMGFGAYLYSVGITKKDIDMEKQYSEAGGMVQQAIANIKTVKQFNGEQYQADQYSRILLKVNNIAKYGLLVGLGIGSLYGAILLTYALSFWFGSHCVEGSNVCPTNITGGKYQPGDILAIFFCIFFAGFNFTQFTPAVKKIIEGRLAAARIYKIIDRKPEISSQQNCIKPETFHGIFRFQNVCFAYPKDPSKKILNNLSFQLKQKSTAFVGDSGCGKSTIFQLMMRFYDPDEGTITLDGNNLKDLDLSWLREQIGYISQEPVLFATSLKQNLLFGRENATEAEIQSALRQAEAFDFVESLKDKLETFAGAAGSQISGGQKQRIAIARALIKNPKILLFDEATSALDHRNEKNIQKTIQKIASQKKTITIAHRIKTIKNCKQIFVIEKGKVLEYGSFDQLVRYKEFKTEDYQLDGQNVGKDNHEQQKCVEDVNSPQNGHIIEIKHDNTKAINGQAENRSKQKQEELLKKYDGAISGRLFSYINHKKGFFVSGIISCIIAGVVFPVFSIFLGKMVGVLFDFKQNSQQARKNANEAALFIFIIGIISFIANTIQHTIFSIIGEDITNKIRNQTYLKILKMPITWTDKPQNSSGALSVSLASDCKKLNSIITTYISVLIQNASSLIAGITIGLIYDWRIGLVSTGLVPFMFISGAIFMQFTAGFGPKTDSAYKQSSNLITQTMANIRTVTSFARQRMVSDRYALKLLQPQKIAMKKGHITGILFGFSQVTSNLIFVIAYFVGAIFFHQQNLKLSNVFTAIYSVIYASITAGNNTLFMPDIVAAKQSAANIFSILDSEDQDQLQIKEQSRLLTSPILGNIEIKNASFKYESRNQYVFQNLNIEIKSGQKIGFVGTSGCGKSTIFQLLQRFYNLQSGQILIDGINIQDYDIHHLRANFGMVSQEPALFNDTIENNIRYNRTNTSTQEIVAAAEAAYFNPEKEDFIESTSVINRKSMSEKYKAGKGFQKNVGPKGSHISGGQKQRVAIARIVIRKPNILLLDEATSALDSVNEQSVQFSLDNLMKGKTCLEIAHRIDTIKNSNLILVFEKGEIVEKGTYNELINLRGHLYRLQKGLQFK